MHYSFVFILFAHFVKGYINYGLYLYTVPYRHYTVHFLVQHHWPVTSYYLPYNQHRAGSRTTETISAVCHMYSMTTISSIPKISNRLQSCSVQCPFTLWSFCTPIGASCGVKQWLVSNGAWFHTSLRENAHLQTIASDMLAESLQAKLYPTYLHKHICF